MTWPDRRAWLFAAKTFAAALLALYVSLRLGLPRPFWAMSTCYIVAQPWSGMARAKGLFRLLGTLAGAVVAIALVPNLVNAPELLSVAMAAWVASCLAASMLAPAPQNYAFLLAGYTAAIIGFPTLDQPNAIFDTAIARTLEISTGILCVLLVETIFPVRAAPAVLRQLDQALGDLSRLAGDVLAGTRDAAALRAERQAVAADNAALAGLIAHLRYEPPSGLNLRAWVPVLHQRMRPLPLLLASLADRATALRAADPASLTALMPLLRVTALWLRRASAAPDTAVTESEALLAAIDQSAARPPATNWAPLLRAGLLSRLRALVVAWRETLTARQSIGGAGLPAPADRVAAAAWPPVSADFLAASLAGAGVFAAIAAMCAFWISTGWAEGAAAATWVAIGAALSASQDNPAAAAVKFLAGTLAALAITALYLFAILPHITTGFVPLAIALGLFLLPAGAAQGMPALVGWAMPMNMVCVTNLALTAHFSVDFGAFASAGLASVVGIFAAQLALTVTRPAGLAWRVTRLIRADRAALARVARGDATDHADVLALMLDRFDAVAIRLPGAALDDAASLIGLRLAMSVMELRTLRPGLPPRFGLRVDRVLRHVARHMAAGEAAMPDPALRAAVDTTLQAAVDTGQHAACLALTGLRRVLLPAAPPPALARHDLALAA